MERTPAQGQTQPRKKRQTKMRSALPRYAHAGAQICQRTLVTLGFAGIADLATKGDPLMVDRLPILVRQNLEQILLGLERLFGVRLGTQHQAVRDAVDVRIHRDGGDVEGVGQLDNGINSLSDGIDKAAAGTHQLQAGSE